MATYDTGSFIRQMRRERGVTQEQLCKGLCSVSTLSKIERGRYTPPGYIFRKLMERLGNYYGRHYNLFLDKDDFERWQIMESISNELVSGDIALAENLLLKRWGTEGFDDGLGLQFMLNAKMSLTTIKVEKAKSEHAEANPWELSQINYDEWLAMAYKSIQITITDFDESNVSNYMLAHEEIKAILHLAGAYFYHNEFEKAAPVLLSLKKSLDKFCPDQFEKARYYPVIIFDIAEVMYELKRYDEAISACELGRQFCIECCRSREIPYFMSIQSKSLIEMGDAEEGKAMLCQSYTVSLALGEKDNAKAISAYYLKTFGAKLELCCK